MAGPLLHSGCQVKCAHGGTAQPTVPNPRVLVGGQATVQQTGPWVVAACPLPPPTAGNGPCVTAQWTTGTVRVTSGLQPLLVMGSQGICAPTGTPVLTLGAQIRVVAT